MGLDEYYWRFVKWFSKVPHPITSLQKKGINFKSTTKCEESLQQLKSLLTSLSILTIANPNEEFLVCIDTCKEGIGGVLMHDRHVVCYESKKLKGHERIYATHDLELDAIVHALKMWIHYLLGRKFQSRTNPISLKYIFEQHI